MRLPQHLVESLCFTFPTVDDFVTAYGPTPDEMMTIKSLTARGLPPIVSQDALATMMGVNPGLIWSFAHRQQRHYSTFSIKKGTKVREITAPRVALKVLQTWVSHHLARSYVAPEHVFGFVPGRSHIGAALEHAGAAWALSVDLRDFFPTTPIEYVRKAYSYLGFPPEAAHLLGALSTLLGTLPQGAPTSPPLSNICFRDVDAALGRIARDINANLTRYADDIVFSGTGDQPRGLLAEISRVLADTPWSVAEEKTALFPLKGRIKVHGLIIRGGRVRLSKGYRNKLRAYSHILRTRETIEREVNLRGHVEYARHVATVSGDTAFIPSLEVPPRLVRPAKIDSVFEPEGGTEIAETTAFRTFKRLLEKLKGRIR